MRAICFLNNSLLLRRQQIGMLLSVLRSNADNLAGRVDGIGNNRENF